jgi:hypothetical protein
MTALPPRSRSLRHLVWLLWIALLLPAAQVAATSHFLSHASADAAAAGEHARAPHALHCDLCLAANAIAGGALPRTLPSLSLRQMASFGAPCTAFDNLCENLLALAYQGRAPPAELR